MAESTLGMALLDLKQSVGQWEGWGSDDTAWTASQLAYIESRIKDGLRQFYLPPRLPGQTRGHRWSFLRPIESTTLYGQYSTGTVTIAAGTPTVVTLTDGVFPTWVADGTGTSYFMIDGTAYAVALRDGDTQITLSTAADAAAGADYSVYRLTSPMPDLFAGVDGGFLTFDINSGEIYRIPIVGEAQIRAYTQGTLEFGRPTLAAIQPRAHSGSGSISTRFDVVTWPIAEQNYTVRFRCLINPDMLDLAHDDVYPPGGAVHAQTIEASCLAAAEFKKMDAKGAQWERFMERLDASIQEDLRQVSTFHGLNEDHGDDCPVNRSRVTSLLFEGVEYD